jgi:hypothetical protein
MKSCVIFNEIYRKSLRLINFHVKQIFAECENCLLIYRWKTVVDFNSNNMHFLLCERVMCAKLNVQLFFRMQTNRKKNVQQGNRVSLTCKAREPNQQPKIANLHGN